ncbi:MAG: hypothetical protein HYY84_09535 [Deltaproteobacteria bacterium]|nr:hypothetical protein [Deltaproteobacteria bacterium]
MTGPVWGSDIYTTDSAICAAALHAGVVTRAGGAVVVVPTGGCRTYNGVTRNGISSGAWGEYESSFYFKGYGDGKCQTETPGCPGAFGQILNVSAATVRECDCGPKPPDGSVWGTAIYTSDSSICAAAWHAGAVTTRGGKVTVKGAPGCGSYKGSVQNGVASADWGSYQLSFFFPAKGPAKCP